MAPKRLTTPLAALEASFTLEDLEAAKKILAKADADKTEKRRLESNMTYYLQQSGELNKGNRLSGDARRKFLLLYLAKQAKDKNASAAESSVRDVLTTASSSVAKKWMSKEKMILELGEKKASAWIASGKLECRPCSVTGSTDEDLKEYHCPEQVNTTLETDTTGVKFVATTDVAKTGVDGALADIDDMAKNMVHQQIGTEKAIKKEPVDASPEEIQKKALLLMAVVKDPRSVLHRLRDVEMDCRTLRDAQSQSPYVEKVKEDAGKLLPKLTKIIKAVESMMGCLDPASLNFAEVQRLEERVQQICEEFEAMKEWGIRLGLVAAGRSAKKPKKAP